MSGIDDALNNTATPIAVTLEYRLDVILICALLLFVSSRLEVTAPLGPAIGLERLT
jgi:hypothetical protein